MYLRIFMDLYFNRLRFFREKNPHFASMCSDTILYLFHSLHIIFLTTLQLTTIALVSGIAHGIVVD